MCNLFAWHGISGSPEVHDITTVYMQTHGTELVGLSLAKGRQPRFHLVILFGMSFILQSWVAQS